MTTMTMTMTMIIGSLNKYVFERQPEVRPSPFSYALTLTNCIAKFLFSYKDDLPETFNQPTSQ